MKVSDYIASFLYTQDVKFIFEVIGGMITHLVDSIHCQNRIRLVTTHHEQAAAFAAEATARITGRPGVSMATSGPGAVNFLTGICSCYFDSIPAIFITGQVNRNEQKGTYPIRQLGFQETDIVSMASPITKSTWRVQSSEEVPAILEKAFNIAMSGRPGPVLIDIPMDIQRAEITTKPATLITPSFINHCDPTVINKLLDELHKAQKPLILVGGGVRSAQATDLFRIFLEHVKVPVVNSLMGVDILPYDNPLRVGMIGTYGNRWANLAVGQSDFLLVLGSRLDIRQTGADVDAFKGNRTIWHVDCEPDEINHRVKGCHVIQADLRSFFKIAIQNSTYRTSSDYSAWLSEIINLKHMWPDTAESHEISGIHPNEFMHGLAIMSRHASAFVTDVGNHQMWAAQSLELGPNQRFLTSGGLGAMGFALPSAIGVAFACPDQPVVMIAGDGGFQLNIQELETVTHNNLPIKMVILNNQSYGMVRQFQQSYFKERYQSTYWGYSAPDYSLVAQAYGIASRTLINPRNVKEALHEMWHDPSSPFLLQVMIDTFINAYPKIAFGRPMTKMEPLVKPIDIEST